MAQPFSIDIERIVDWLGLERDPRAKGGSAFNVRCPFCSDQKYHMNINTDKGTYYCLLCTGDDKGTGALDLYGRVAHGTRLVPGRNGNGKELFRQLCSDLQLDSGRHYVTERIKTIPELRCVKRASDDQLHAAYSALLEIKHFTLSDQHRDNLRKRGLSDTAICTNGYRTIDADLKWIHQYRHVVDINDYECLKVIRGQRERLRHYSREQLIAGLIVADMIQKSGIVLEGIPGFFRLGSHWCFLLEEGMVIPTRNAKKQIVALQVRKDNGNLRYKTVSSKGLPEGVTEGIARVHMARTPGQYERIEHVLLTEGPLKADIICHLHSRPAIVIAIPGVTSALEELRSYFCTLAQRGYSEIYNALDMDKLTNPHVAKASRRLRRITRDCGLAFPTLCWDREYAQTALHALQVLACEKELHGSMETPQHNNVFIQLGVMAQVVTPDAKGAGKTYWRGETKGLDDYYQTIMEGDRDE